MSSAAETTVIELGLLEPESQPEPVPSAWWRSWWRRHQGRTRRWAPAAVVVALLLPLSGAAGAVEPALRLLWTVSDVTGPQHSRNYTTDDAYLYLAAAGQMTAYRLADGRVSWEVPFEDAGENFRLQVPRAGVLTVTVFGSDPYVEVYEAGTGELRWRRPGLLFLVADHGAVLFGEVVNGLGARRPVYVDYETGGVQRILIPDGWDDWFGTRGWGSAPRGSAVFSLARDGTLTRYDMDSGTGVATVQTPHDGREPDTEYHVVSISDDLVMVSEYDGSSAVALTAYDAATLAHRWSLPRGGYPAACHSLVCVPVSERLQEQLHAVDPMTGEIRWTIDCAGLGARGCSGPAVQETPGNRLWLRLAWVTGSEVEQDQSWVVDAETGELLSSGVGWDLWTVTGETDLLLSQPVEGEPMRRWWARSDTSVDRIEVLGTIEAERCDPQYPYLVCWDGGEDLAIWRVGAEA